MDNRALARYAEKVPFVVKAGIRGLSDDSRLGIAVALMEEGRMTFSEMAARFGLDPDTLRGHLAALQKGDLVRNYCEKGDNGPFSYYEATGLPDALLDAFFVVASREGRGRGRPDGTGAAG